MRNQKQRNGTLQWAHSSSITANINLPPGFLKYWRQTKEIHLCLRALETGTSALSQQLPAPASSWFIRDHTSCDVFLNGVLTCSHLVQSHANSQFSLVKVKGWCHASHVTQQKANKNPGRRWLMSLCARHSRCTGHGNMKHHVTQVSSLLTELSHNRTFLMTTKAYRKQFFNRAGILFLTFN